MYIGFYKPEEMAEVNLVRGGNRINVTFEYFLSGFEDFRGDVSMNIGSVGKNYSIDSNFDNDLYLSFSVATPAGKTIKCNFEMNDYNDGTTIQRSFTLTRFDEGANYTGTAGSDLVFGAVKKDVINGGRGVDFIDGNSGNDNLKGGGGNDRLIGGIGNDTLTGGAGDDQFFFTNHRGTDFSVDKITDFDAAHETIWLRALNYWALPSSDDPQELSKDMFSRNSLGKAQDSDDHIIYETDTGLVYYDEDGRGGVKGYAIAKLDAGMRIEADNFMVY